MNPTPFDLGFAAAQIAAGRVLEREVERAKKQGHGSRARHALQLRKDILALRPMPKCELCGGLEGLNHLPACECEVIQISGPGVPVFAGGT
jgi:hypothetical protein